MRILGIDPGLNITGYGVIEVSDSSFRIIEGGVIKTSDKDPIYRRLGKVYKEIIDITKELSPDVLVLEKLYSHYRHPTTAILMGHVRGVICLVCATREIPLISYSATRIKKAVAGRGNASKYQVKMMVAKLLNLTQLPKYLDVTDALAVAIAYFYIGKKQALK